MIVAGLLFLISVTVRGLLLGLIVALGLSIFRVTRTDARLLAWQMVLYAAIAMPALTVVLPTREWSPPLPAIAVETWSPALATRLALPSTSDVSLTRVVGRRVPAAPTAGPPQPERSETAPSRSVSPWPQIIGVAYLGGCLLLLIRDAIGWWMTRRLELAATEIRDPWICDNFQARADAYGLRRRLRLMESGALNVPITTSTLTPVIVLPRTWRDWPTTTVDAVLTHELAHVERGDVLTQRLALAYCAIFWFSPLGWWLHRQLVRLAEDASDEAALTAGSAPSAYAEMLLAFFAGIRDTTHRVRWNAIAMARGLDAERRIERVLAWRGPARALSRPVLFCVALAASQVVTFAATARWVVPDVPLPTLPSAPRLASTPDVPSATEISRDPMVTVVQAPAAAGRAAVVGSTSTSQQSAPCDLCKAIQDPRLTWLQNYVGRSTFDAVQDSHFRDLVGMVVPNGTYHFGTDMALGEAWMTILRAAGRPVEARNTKYLWLSSCVNARCQPGRGLAFLWVDTLDAVAIGGIYFAPSNGEPTPTLTLFSKQQGPALTKASQLPDAFLQDLATWSATAGIDEVSARYFIAGNGDKSVVPHEERICSGGTSAGNSGAPCGSADLRVAEKDLDAAVYMADSHNAMGSPAQLALRLSQNLWAQSRGKACGATQSPADLACQIEFVRDRIHVLQSGGTR